VNDCYIGDAAGGAIISLKNLKVISVFKASEVNRYIQPLVG